MIQYIVNSAENKIEITSSSGSMQELKDLYELFKDYSFSFGGSYIDFKRASEIIKRTASEQKHFGIQKGNEYTNLHK